MTKTIFRLSSVLVCLTLALSISGFVLEGPSAVASSEYRTEALESHPAASPDGSISGHLYQADGITPFIGADVIAALIGESYLGNTLTASAGSYEITGLLTGDYVVYAHAVGYLLMYYPGSYSSSDALPVTVTAPGNTPNIDFTLDKGGSISGHVYQSDRITPISNAVVYAQGNSGSGQGATSFDGSYTIGLLLPGTYSVRVEDAGHITTYYEGVYDSGLATPVTVNGLKNTVGIDFAVITGGSISGRIYQADGKTLLPGAVVIASLPGKNYSMQTLTAADGTYVITGLPTGSYYLWAMAAGYLLKYYGGVYSYIGAIQVAVAAPGDSPNIDFALDKGGSISGHVYQLDGVTPISNARVALQSSYGFVQRTTASDGGYVIDMLVPGNYVVQADAAGYVTTYYKGVYDYGSATPVVVTGLSDTPGIDFAMDIGGSISGHVYQGNGTAPVAGASVQALALDRVPTNGQAVTAADGSYTVTGLYPGNYRVGTYAVGYVTEYFNGTSNADKATPVGVKVHSDTPGINFTLETGGSLSGHVYRADGHTPIANASISAKLEASDYYYSVSTSTNAEGGYTIRTLPSGYYSVRAYGSNYLIEYYQDTYNYSLATLVLVTAPGDTPGADFKLNTGGSISGHIYRADGGGPISGATVSAQLVGQDQGYIQSTSSTSTSAEGRYILTGLQPGKYQVQVAAASYISQTFGGGYDPKSFIRVSVSLNFETPNIDFVLKTGGSISGRVFEADGSTPIEGASVYAVTAVGPIVSSASTGPDGRYTITRLPTGIYLVKAQASQCPAKYYGGAFAQTAAVPVTVTDPGNTPNININLQIGGTIAGHVYKSDGITPLGSAFVGIRPVAIPNGEVISTSYTKVFPDTGSYTFTGLGPGNYEVFAQSQGFIREYYGGVYSERDATPVSVSISADTPGIDFSLDVGASISGHVYQSDGITPMVDATVVIPDADTNVVRTSADGSYTISGLVSGNYSLFAYASGYLSEYYSGVFYSENATLVSVLAPDVRSGIDFTLDKGGSISGHVLAVDGVSSLSSVFHVSLEPHAAGTPPPLSPSAPSYPPPTVGGAYMIQDLPPGDYKVFASSSNYVTQYYHGVYSAAEAGLIHVTLGNDTPNINFFLAMSGDANSDKAINMADVTKVERVILGLDLQTGGSDANGDGFVNMGDVLKIERFILGLDP